jgi:hypothetical protein
MKGTIGAIDCTNISIFCPRNNDLCNPTSLYMNGKEYYSLNVEAVCDAHLKILEINPKYPGSCHDSGIWTTSPVRAFVCRQESCCLLGDQGYPLEPWLMTSFSSPANSQEEKYNKVHCKLEMSWSVVLVFESRAPLSFKTSDFTEQTKS